MAKQAVLILTTPSGRELSRSPLSMTLEEWNELSDEEREYYEIDALYSNIGREVVEFGSSDWSEDE